ncbi:hypothetical protein AgCh_023853 [Apium graveolens]
MLVYVDAVKSALNSMRFKEIEIVVAEIGWPYKGDPNETPTAPATPKTPTTSANPSPKVAAWCVPKLGISDAQLQSNLYYVYYQNSGAVKALIMALFNQVAPVMNRKLCKLMLHMQ